MTKGSYFILIINNTALYFCGAMLFCMMISAPKMGLIFITSASLLMGFLLETYLHPRKNTIKIVNVDVNQEAKITQGFRFTDDNGITFEATRSYE